MKETLSMKLKQPFEMEISNSPVQPASQNVHSIYLCCILARNLYLFCLLKPCVTRLYCQHLTRPLVCLPLFMGSESAEGNT